MRQPRDFRYGAGALRKADAYLQACKRQAEQAEAMREMYANEIEELMKRRNR